MPLPDINHTWLAEFSRGFFACADAFNIDLIGGDTTRGPLTISVQIMGEVPSGKAIKRSGAHANDDIWVTGALGSSALGLAHLENKLTLSGEALEKSLNALHQPIPRATLGLRLQDIATSCIDISDGLLADLGHILRASKLGATLDLQAMPCHDFLHERLNEPEYQHYILAGGDDYELCFTAPRASQQAIAALSQELNLPISLIGQTHDDLSLTVQFGNNELRIEKKGYDHFE